MKRTFLILLAVLLMTLSRSHADIPTQGGLDFHRIPVLQVLDIYKQLSGLDLVVDSQVKKILVSISCHTNGKVERDEAIKLLEQALLKQAGIVITHLDGKQVSVTYNDALPKTAENP